MKPTQYTKGYTEWYKLKFKVTSDVLIPRPETELLVDEVLKYVNDVIASKAKQSITVLDIGTGSGNIAISIARNLASNKNVKIIAIDISEKALNIARQNARLHGVKNQIDFVTSDLLNNIHDSLFDIHNSKLIIIANLPYIPSARIPTLDSSVKDYEPHLALDGGKDGFEIYRKLFRQIENQKVKFDLLVGEIDYLHKEVAQEEASKIFPKMKVEVKLDLARNPRILIVKS